VNARPLLLAIVSAMLFGCRPQHNMLKQPKSRTEQSSTFFPDGASARPLQTGVVPRPPQNVPGIPYDQVGSPGPAGFPTIASSRNIPFAITQSVLTRGRERFDIYCAVCHGRVGDGNGMIPQRGFQHPPSYFIQRLRDEPDSHFYDVISNGYGTMFSYANRVESEDRWKITAYIRALQLGVRDGTLLTDEDRRRLKEHR